VLWELCTERQQDNIGRSQSGSYWIRVINDPNLQRWSQKKGEFTQIKLFGWARAGQGQPLAGMFNDFADRTILSCQRVGDDIHFQNEVKQCMRSLVQSLEVLLQVLLEVPEVLKLK
jgi:hypothetical protein